jgi:hypothetical protein
MNYKVCTKCNSKLKATTENFYKQKKGLYNLRSKCKKCEAAYSKSMWVVVPKKTEKKCGRCEIIFPLTHEYFFTKTTKKGTIINGKPLSVDSTSFRSICKKCNTAIFQEKKRAKLMIKYNASSEEELDLIIHTKRIQNGLLGAIANLNIRSKRRKYIYPEGATPKEIERLRIIYDKGYDPTTYDKDWKEKWLAKVKANRKYNIDYPGDKIPNSLSHKGWSENMPDAFIVNRLGFKLGEVPQEIIELKRKQLKFYRYVKENQNRNS